MSKSNKFIFLRHAETKKDPSVPAVEWDLTQEGFEKMKEVSTQEPFSSIDVIYSSNEDKAIKTAQPIAENLTKEIIIIKDLKEVQRGEAFLTEAEFNNLKKEKLENRDSAADGGESGNQAIKRFQEALKKIDSENEGKNILVVSHGTVLALFFSDVKNDFSNIFTYWKNMPFCAYGIIENEKVVRDISKS